MINIFFKRVFTLFNFKGGWLSGKMVREMGSAPEGSRVANFSKEGKVPNQAHPNWDEFASNDRAWKILDSCKKIAQRNIKTVAQVWELHQTAQNAS